VGKLKLSKNQKGFTAVEVLLVILILVVIGAVGYMVYHNNHKTNSTNTADKTTSSSSSSKSSTATATNPYAGWQQLCSTGGGLCMKYPSSWKLSGSDSDGYTITSPSGATAVTYEPDGGGMDGGAYSLAGAGGSECPANIASITPLTTNASNLDILEATVNCTANVNSNVTSWTPSYTFISNSEVESQSLKSGQTTPDTFTIGIDNTSTSSSPPQLLFAESTSPNFSTSSAAQQWFSSSDAQTADKILSSVSNN